MEFTFKKFEKTKNKNTVCVVDSIGGNYLPVAIELSNHFEKVYYNINEVSPFPRLSNDKVGVGYDQIEAIQDFWDKINEIDIFIFPDIYYSAMGKHLRDIGKMVWGGTPAEVLETDRKLFKQELKSVGLPVPNTVYIKGIDDLEKYMKTNSDKWMKVSFYRGLMETTHLLSYEYCRVLINELRYTTGPLASTIDFVIEDPIKAIAEIGSDGWTVNGVMPKNQIFGLEMKNIGYVGKSSTYDELPSALKDVNNRFQPVLQKYKHTGFYSTEVRVGEDGKNYYIDPCVRCGLPPSATYLQMVSNLAEIVISGCNGVVVEPKFAAKYGVEIILKSTYVNNNFLPVIFPEEYSKNIKLKGSFKMDNKYYIIPYKFCGYELSEVGCVSVVGDDLHKIMQQALEIAKSIDSYDITYDTQVLEKAQEEINKVSNALKFKF
jgi:hypothetical protein